MFNAASKIIMLAIAAATFASCSGDPDKEAAQSLVQRAKEALDKGNVDQSLALMDSVDKQYPSQLQARREVTALRPMAIQQAAMKKIAYADSLIAATQLTIQELEAKFKHVSGGDLDGYYVVDGAHNKNFINTTSFEPRINDHDFTFYIVSNSNGKTIGTNQVALYTADAECKSEIIPSTSERVMRVEGSEIASFLPEEVDALGEWAANNPDIKGGYIYGSKGNQKVALNKQQAQAFGLAWQYSHQKLLHRQALLMREKLDRQLQIARDQAANVSQPAE